MKNPRRTEAQKLHKFLEYLHYRALHSSSIKLTDDYYQAQLGKKVIVEPTNFSSVEDNIVRLNVSDLNNKSIVGDFDFTIPDTAPEPTPE